MAEPGAFEERVLDAADELFYAHGFHAVGMDRIRDASGVTLRRLYQCFPSKNALVEAYLRRRERTYRASLDAFVAAYDTPRERLLAVFDWMNAFFGEPGFRGCAFLNAFSEVGPVSEDVAQVVRDSKASLRAFLAGLARDAGAREPDAVARQLLILFDGATSVAAVGSSPTPAQDARSAATAILDASGGDGPASGGTR